MSPVDVPVAGTAEWLQQYGPWALVVICFGVIVFLFRALSTARDAHEASLSAHAEEIRSLTVEHKQEMIVLLNRLIATGETQIREYHTLAERVTTVVDSLQKRLESKGFR